MNKIEEAVSVFDELMSSRGHGNILEQLGRNEKGELFVLRYLNSCVKQALPSELSEALRSSTARISAVLRTLEKKRQIQREIDTTNRRNIIVTITDEGRKRIMEVEGQMKKNLAQIFSEMGEDDAVDFIRLLKKFHEIAGKTIECPK